MTKRIKVAEYHLRPVVELEMPDGSLWKLRQPLEADYFRWEETAAAFDERTRLYRERTQARAREIAEKAKAVAKETGSDDEARALIDEESSKEARTPLDCTRRYLHASLLSIYIEPEQTPENLLSMLGPDIINELLGLIGQVVGGDAAKKRIAGN